MSEEQDAKDSHSDSGSKTYGKKGVDKKAKPLRPLTKIILRRLPPTMTEEAFLEQVSPIPEHDFVYFSKPDLSLGGNFYSRAYINFVNVDDIYLFRDKFDGYVFLDEKGVEYVGIVEYAPFQRIPKKKKKKDPKCGTIESDPIFQEFIENLSKDQETDNQPKLEYSYPVNDSNEKKVQTTPLLEYLAARKQDKRGRDERRRRENDKRKMRIERKCKDVTIKEEEIDDVDLRKIKSRDWEKTSSDLKDNQSKDDFKDGSKFDSRPYRKVGSNITVDRRKKIEGEKKSNVQNEEDVLDEAETKKETSDKAKESPREQKSKKYSDTRKERIKQAETSKSDKQTAIIKMMNSDGKVKALNHDDIKPFTQLPHVKTDDLTKLLEKAKLKSEESKISTKEAIEDIFERHHKSEVSINDAKKRRNSLEPGDLSMKEEHNFQKQKSFDDRSRSVERQDSEETEKSESSERRSERRIRNKDRPSLAIYQPGMGKLSKQRMAKEKESPTTKPVNESEKKDT